jgi:hypothetical protein
MTVDSQLETFNTMVSLASKGCGDDIIEIIIDFIVSKSGVIGIKDMAITQDHYLKMWELVKRNFHEDNKDQHEEKTGDLTTETPCTDILKDIKSILNNLSFNINASCKEYSNDIEILQSLTDHTPNNFEIALKNACIKHCAKVSKYGSFNTYFNYYFNLWYDLVQKRNATDRTSILILYHDIRMRDLRKKLRKLNFHAPYVYPNHSLSLDILYDVKDCKPDEFSDALKEVCEDTGGGIECFNYYLELWSGITQEKK